MAEYIIKLKIADIIIYLESAFAIRLLTAEDLSNYAVERFNCFFYKGSKKPAILIKVKITEKLPLFSGKRIFTTVHFQDQSENWRLYKNGNNHIYGSFLESREQVMLINEAFDEIKAHLLLKSDKKYSWRATDIIYDFLQILLINYFAQRKQGIFTHSVGIKDIDGKGLLFAGKSGCGKSTTARIWHKYSKAMILNDDRIIIRKRNGAFFIHGSPWHGEFSDYLASKIDAASLKKIFFIHHAPKNTVRKISVKDAFNLLYPALFPAFWDKKCLENIAGFCEDLLMNIPCYSLGFINNREMIGFVRNIG